MKKIFLIPLALTSLVTISTVSTIAVASSYHNKDSEIEVKKSEPETKKTNSISSLIPIILAAAVPVIAIIILIPIFIYLIKRKKEKKSDHSSPNKKEEKEVENKKIEEDIPSELNTLETEEFDINIDDISAEPQIDKSEKQKVSLNKHNNNIFLKIKPGQSKKVLEIDKIGNKHSFETVLFKKASTLVDETMNLIDNFIMDNLNIKIIKNYKSIINTIDSISSDEQDILTKGYNMCKKFLESKNSNIAFLNKEWLDELNSISSKIIKITEEN